MGLKIILSRKGMDTSIGKLASPIFEDGTMLSLPIPVKNENETGLEYEKLSFKVKEKTISQIIELLIENNNLESKVEKYKICHYDPIINDNISGSNECMKSFGQSDSAGKYLLDYFQNKKNDDTLIFLFFGRFRFVDENYKYFEKTSCLYKNNDIHVIWGYLVVDKYYTNEDICNNNLDWHPHAQAFYKEKKNNVIFVGDGNVLSFDPRRVLTKIDRTQKDIAMAVWDKRIFDGLSSNSEGHAEGIPFERHPENFRKNSNKDNPDELFIRGQWQELILTNDDECKKLLRKFGLEYLYSKSNYNK